MLKRLLMLAAVSVLIVRPASGAEFVLKAGHDNNVKMPYHLGMVKFKEIVEEKSNGRVEVKIYPNSQLGNEAEMIKGILTGSLEMCVTSASKLVNFIPEVKVFTLPFLFNNPAHMDAVLTDQKVRETLADASASKGFRVLGVFSAGVRHIMNSKKPLFSMEDLKGLKIRVMSNPVDVASFRAFGANPTPIAYDELYGALQTHVVDGAEAANTNYWGLKFYEVAPYWAQVSWMNLMSPVIMSEKKFQSLPKDVQEIFMQAGIEAAEYQRAVYIAADQENYWNLVGAGVKITQMNSAPFRDAAQKVYAEFVKTEKEKSLLSAIRAVK